MITLEQAKTLRHGDELHGGKCRKHVGPRGGVSYFIERWRVNGRLHVVKSRNFWKLPIKYGMWNFMAVTPYSAHLFHVANDCPLNKEKA